MTYWLLAIVITGAAFAIATAAAWGVTALASPFVLRRVAAIAPAGQARGLFLLRIWPGAAALAATLFVVMPVFLIFEPRDTQEPIRLTLVGMGAFGLVLLARGGIRALHAWLATRRVASRWLRTGRRIDSPLPMPVYAVAEPFPIVAVAGIRRPTLFIAERVLRDFAPELIDVMLAHECVHVRRRDNLKRLVMRFLPAAPGRGAWLDRAWSLAAEQTADAGAAAGDPARALLLADALVRIARLAVGPSQPEAMSAFYLGGDVEARVRHLLELTPDHAPRPMGCVVLSAFLCLGAATAVAGAPVLHSALEALVRVLS